MLGWSMNRRRFVQSSVAGGLTLAVTPRALLGQAPTIMSSKSAKPVVISSANGNKFKNGGDMTCVHKAFTMMTSGNADVLDALIAGVNIVELDPLDDSVGYGGVAQYHRGGAARFVLLPWPATAGGAGRAAC